MGQPSHRHGWLFLTEFIGVESDTRGSETSQYPVEEKSNEIPSVVASESGRAQTMELAPWGCGTAIWHNVMVAERSGKSGHRR